MASDEEEEGRVGELFTWGQATGGSKVDLLAFRSCKVRKLTGKYDGACVMYEGLASALNASPITHGLNADNPEVSRVSTMEFGDSHVVMLKTDGSLWARGSGSCGQLGLGAKVLKCEDFLPVLALAHKKVTTLDCGAHHSAAVTSSGDLYLWGRGFEGQTGHASPALDDATNKAITGVQLLPKLVATFVRKPIASVACGENFTTVLTRTGEVWSWGEGQAGQLGYGRVTKQMVPKKVISQCPATGAAFADISCGWAHTLARTAAGDVYAWGFNAYGQLGLGHVNAMHYPTAVTPALPESAKQGAKPGFVVDRVWAAHNYSAALMHGDLYTWGCGGHGRLGHEGNEHELAPRHVVALLGKQVSSFAMMRNDMFVFVPSVVYDISPPLGPMSGGARIVIRGGGFWESEDIVVRFQPLNGSMSRSSIGTFALDPVTGAQSVSCKIPRFAEPGEATVEIAMNGKDFTRNGVKFEYYRDPVLSSVFPSCCSKSGSTELKIEGEDLFDGSAISVRFKEKGGEGRECVVRAKCVSYVEEGWFNPETEEEEDVEHTHVVCASPQFEGELPVETRVALALNGQDYVTLANGSLIVHDASIKELSPSAVPLVHDTAVEELARDPADRPVVKLVGKSLFNSGTLKVRLSFADREGAPYECEVPCDYVNRETVTFVAPTERQLWGLPEKVELVEGEEGEEGAEGGAAEGEGGAAAVAAPPADDSSAARVSLDGADAASATGEGAEDAAANGEEGAAEPEAELLKHYVLNCTLELSVDGETYVEGSLPFTCYIEAEIDVDPPCGPATGGTKVAILSLSNFERNGGDEALVRLSSEDGCVFAEVPATTEKRVKTTEEGEEQEYLAVVFETPEPKFRPQSKTAENADDAAGAPAGDEEGGEAGEEGGAEEAAPDAAPEASPAEGGAAEGGDAEGGDADAMSHMTASGPYSVNVSVALNGKNFSPHVTTFAFYQEPAKLEVSPKEVDASTQVSVTGTGLYDTSRLVARLTYVTEGENGELGEAFEQVAAEFESLADAIKFELPSLPVTLAAPPAAEGAAAAEDGAEPAAAGDDAEEPPEPVPEGMAAVGVEISLNGGANFTKSGLRVFYAVPAAAAEAEEE